MLLTEAQAKTKWCPHVRLPAQFQAKTQMGVIGIAAATPNVTESPIAGHALTRNGEHNCCIGSKCSQWRWAKYNEDGQRILDQAPAVGYCGISGEPQS